MNLSNLDLIPASKCQPPAESKTAERYQEKEAPKRGSRNKFQLRERERYLALWRQHLGLTGASGLVRLAEW